MKAGAFQISSPATITLLWIISNTLFKFPLYFFYISIMSSSSDPGLYEFNDNVRPWLFSFWLFTGCGGVLEVLMLWIEILSKSKKMTGAGDTAKKYKLICRGVLCVLLLFTLVCLAFGLEGA